MKAKRFLIAVNVLVIGILACSAAGSLINPPNAAATNTALASMVKKIPLRPQMVVGATWPYADGTTLVPVPAGPFTMGVAGGADNPAHTVNLSSFWIYRTEVTNSQYAYCVSQKKCTAPDPVDDPGFGKFTNLNDPVTGVAWQQATDYCGFVHGRLPTEAEWEKTARGPSANTFPWGNTAPSCDLLNFKNCAGHTTNVVSHPLGQSYYHALDTAGNAFEWVRDFYDSAYYPISPAQDPPGPEIGTQRVVRSTGFTSKDAEVPTYVRRFQAPESHRGDLGFRCVVEDSGPSAGPAYFAPACETPRIMHWEDASSSQSFGDCPTVDVSVTPGSCGTNHTSVTFTSSDVAETTTIDLGGAECTASADQTPGSVTLDCTKAGHAEITAVCGVPGVTECPLGSTFDPSSQSCKPDRFRLLPSSGQCLFYFDETLASGNLGALDPSGNSAPGNIVSFDPVNQCCHTPPIDVSVFYPACPAGTQPGVDLGQVVGSLALGAQFARSPQVCIGGEEKLTNDEADIVMPSPCVQALGIPVCTPEQHLEGNTCKPGPCAGAYEIVHGDCELKCTGHQTRDHDGNCVDVNNGGGGPPPCTGEFCN